MSYFRACGHSGAVRNGLAALVLPVVLAVALPASAQTSSANPADESEGDTMEFETFEVTGSRIRRSDFETAQPVLVINREDIERTGLNSIGEILQGLPQAGASLGRAFNNGGDGSVEIDLRNLGSNRVLVLVNGHRWIPSTRVLSTGGVDLTTIPTSIVERIEVLQDGASAVYGSDAVAGVVNIITRKDFQGLQSSVQGATYGEGDGQEQAMSFAAGSVAGKTSSFVDVSYRKAEPVFAGDRPISNVPVLGTGLTRGSIGTPQGSFLFVPNGNNQAALGEERCFTLAEADDVAFGAANGQLAPVGTVPFPDVALSGMVPGAPEGVPLCFVNYREGAIPTDPVYGDYPKFDFYEDPYNFAPINYLLTPQERTSIFGQVTHQITPNISFNSELLFNVRKSRQLLAEMPLFAGDLFPAPFNLAYVAMDQAFNPFMQDIGQADPAAGLVGTGAIARRMVELGRRDFQQDNSTFRIGLGFGGNFDFAQQFFFWDAGYIFAESKNEITESNLLDLERVATALGPAADCDADPDCVPLDVFNGVGSITQDMLDYISYTALDQDRTRQRTVYGNMSTEFGQFADWLAGPLGLAVGFEARDDFLNSQPDPLKVKGTSSTNLEQPTSGRTEIIEAYAEVGIPLLRDLPFVEDLNLTLASRFSDYQIPDAVRDVTAIVPNPVLDPTADEFDPSADPETTPENIEVVVGQERFTQKFDNTSGKLGLEYRPLPGLLTRTSWSDSFRAPAVSELFLGELQSFPFIADPCSGYTNASRDDEENIENIRENCQSDGVPTGYSQSGGQITTVFGGNSQLVPETAQSYSVGFVWSPGAMLDVPALDQFDVAIDVFRYELEDFITVPSAAVVLQLCYEAPPEQRSLCQFVNRTGGGQIDNLQTIFTNFAELNTDGVDINMNWVLPWFREYGEFRWIMDASYTHSYEQVLPSPGGESRTDLVGFAFSVGTIPRWKANSTLEWKFGPWNASWTMRFIDRTFEVCDDGLAAGLTTLNGGERVNSLEEFGLCSHPGDNPLPGGGVGPLNELERTFYHDIQAGYSLPFMGGAQITGGIRNLFNEDPPVQYTALTNSYNVAEYDLPNSMFPYVRFNLDF